MTKLTGLLDYMFSVFEDGGMSREEAVQTTIEVLYTQGYVSKPKWKSDQEGDMW